MRRVANAVAVLWPWGTLARAALADPEVLVALLNAEGEPRFVKGGLAAAAPDDLLGALPERAHARVRAALNSGARYQADTTLAGTPVRLRLNPGPLAGGGTLHLRDRSREASLDEALEQAQRLQEVGELAGGIAHDFNNLLTAILGAAEEMLADESASGLRSDLLQIEASAKRGAELVRQLLAFSQRQTLQPRPLVLDDAVGRAAGLLRRLLGSRITLDLQLDAPGRLVLMDATQLDQVLMNLAVNARNAMPENGGRISIRTGFRLVLGTDKPPPGQVGDMPTPGRYVMLEIADTGCGIPADMLPRIFDPFFTTRRNEGGTGLGLAMALGIIRQSGGFLSARSIPGEGTTFQIAMQRCEGAAPAAEREPASATAAPRRERATGSAILLVDDDDAIRLLARRALAREGWTVIEAADGEEALGHADGPIACVISDVSMPGLDGPGLVRALRARQPGLPAILISGYANDAQRRMLAEEDIVFLAKPFGLADLTALVARSLAKTAASVA